VDDGSTDATLIVARQFESPIVRVVTKEHTGKADTINLALQQSQGDHLQYLDADDVLALNKIQLQVERLSVEPPGSIATCAWARFYDGDHTSAVLRSETDFRDYDAPVEWLIQSWNGRGTMPPIAWLVPRTVISRAGAWHEGLSLNDDTEYFTRVVLASSRIAFCEDAYGYYRSGNASLSGKRSRAALESFYKVCELCTGHLITFEQSDRTREACANLWQHFAYWVYPNAPDLIRSAEANAASFGGASLKLRGSRAFEAARRLVGWKASRRVQLARQRSL
jgi:glycosyltransferase involved in cell wall biosynthesis